MSKVKITGKALVAQLGREQTRLVLMGKGGMVLHAITVPTPEDAVEDGMIRSPEAVREMLKTALKQTPEFKRIRQIVFALCTSQVITEVVRVPSLNPSKTEKLIQANIDNYFPVDVHDYQIIWQTVAQVQDEMGMKEQDIQLWAIPNSIIKRYYQVANECGLSVEAIDYCGNSIATSAGLTFARKEEKAGKSAKSAKKFDLNMELNFGTKKKQAKVEEEDTSSGGTATATRTAPNTNLYVSLDNDLLGMTFAQNGQVVYQRFVSCGSNPVYQFDELAMMVEYFQSMEFGRGSHIRGVVVGSLAEDEMLVAELQDMLGVPLGRFRGECAASMVFCAGAIRTTMDFGNPALNKVTTARAQMAAQLWQYGVVLAGGLALIAVVTFTFSARLVWNLDISSLNTTKQALQIQAAKVAGFADNYKKYENNYNSYSADWETVFSSMRTYNDNLVLMLEELESIMPEKTSVTGLSIAANGMSVQFACDSKEEAAYLIMALRELQYADLLSISNLSGGGGGPATSYGSGEQAPKDGSGPSILLPNGILIGVNTVEATEILYQFDLIGQELTAEEVKDATKDLTDQELLNFDNKYSKTPGMEVGKESEESKQERPLRISRSSTRHGSRP